MITTLTTIGYGDTSARSELEKMYIMFIQFFGILIFTSFNYAISESLEQRLQPVDEVVKGMKKEVADLMYDISSLSAVDNTLEGKTYDDALIYIEDSIRFSTRQSFENNKFWRLLHPKLKNRLVSQALNLQIHVMRFFFEDYVERQKAPPGFVTKIMTHLDATVYSKGDFIVRNGDTVDALYFFIQGRGQLKGTLVRDGHDPESILVCNLVEGSWFGDYQILFGQKSTWDLFANVSKKEK